MNSAWSELPADMSAPVAIDSRRRIKLRLRMLLGILTAFWVYVTVSNVLYANSMQLSIATFSDKQFFAPWTTRVLQHLLLYPVFLGCVWTSLRSGWSPLWRALPLQILLAIFFCALPFFAMTIAEHMLGEHDPHEPLLGMLWSWHDPAERAIWFASATSFFLTYGFGVALASGFKLYQHFRDSELRLTAMSREWSAARLSALRMQLSPHTLFNLLNTIRGHITWEPAMAQSMVVQLADLLRRLLNAGETEFSRLRDEITVVRLYLELQQKRFADRLSLSLPDSDALPTTWVPSLILQPLVENAVVHGLAGNKHPVTISVETEVIDDMLVLRVINNFVSQANGDHEGHGIGLRNVTERIAVHFPQRAELKAGPVNDHQWCAELRIPMLGDGANRRTSS